LHIYLQAFHYTGRIDNIQSRNLAYIVLIMVNFRFSSPKYLMCHFDAAPLTLTTKVQIKNLENTGCETKSVLLQDYH